MIIDIFVKLSDFQALFLRGLYLKTALFSAAMKESLLTD